jgi:calpain-15
VVQWRRPHEFFEAEYSNLKKDDKSIFLENTIEPTDVRMGVLGDEWFLSALAMLAERPALIERLFITKKVND